MITLTESFIWVIVSAICGYIVGHIAGYDKGITKRKKVKK